MEWKCAYRSKYSGDCCPCVHCTDKFATITKGDHLADYNHAHDLFGVTGGLPKGSNQASRIPYQQPRCSDTYGGPFQSDDFTQDSRWRHSPAIALPMQNQIKSVATAQNRVPRSKNAIEVKSMSLDPYRSVPRPKMG